MKLKAFLLIGILALSAVLSSCGKGTSAVPAANTPETVENAAYYIEDEHAPIFGTQRRPRRMPVRTQALKKKRSPLTLRFWTLRPPLRASMRNCMMHLSAMSRMRACLAGTMICLQFMISTGMISPS